MSTSKKKGAQQPAQVVTGGVGHGEVDPIALALRPPADETPQQRAARIRDEAEAKKVSDSIDAQLAVDSAEREKARKRGDIKILLLGKSNLGWKSRGCLILPLDRVRSRRHAGQSVRALCNFVNIPR